MMGRDGWMAAIRTWTLLVILSAAPVWAQVRLDLSTVAKGTPVRAELEAPDYRIEIEANYDPVMQKLAVDGRYWPGDRIESEALLSYQVLDTNDQLLMADGARYDWAIDERGRRVADFKLDLPMLDERPDLVALRVRFNAVVEGQYWYRDQFPDLAFPTVEVVGIPARDAYAAAWTFLPRWLPAQTWCRVPVIVRIRHRDVENSGFVATLDTFDPKDNERIESKRVSLPENMRSSGLVEFWLPVEPAAVGDVEMRPGLVWDQVRWYDSAEWFHYRRVTLVPPLIYLAWMVGVAVAMVALWRSSHRWRRANLRWAARLATVPVALGLLGVATVTGYWIVLGALGAVALLGLRRWRRPGLHAYFVTWFFVSFLEIYWSWMSVVVPVARTATILAVAVWALVLMPLMGLRGRRTAWLLAGVIGTGWLVFSTAAVIYYTFFQDFPSVENLIYVGQLSDVGQSVFALIEQRHVVPILVEAMMILLVAGSLIQRKTQTENT